MVLAAYTEMFRHLNCQNISVILTIAMVLGISMEYSSHTLVKRLTLTRVQIVQ